MTVLQAGGEDTSFTIVGTGGFASASTSFYRNTFSRGYIQQNNASVFPPGSYFTLPAFTPQSTVWVHAQMTTQTATTPNNLTTLNWPGFMLYDGATCRILVRGTGTAGQVKISKRNAAGTITDLVTSTGTFSNGLHAWDLFVNYSTTGQATFYCDGVAIADTGAGVDVTTDGATTLNQAYFAGWGGGAQCWSECIVQDTSTLGAALLTIPPVASGTTQDWTPNTVANVSKSTINDATFVSTTANDKLSEWTVSTSLPGSNIWSIAAVVQNLRLQVGTTGPQHADFLVRTVDGTDHTAGTVAPPTSFTNYSYIWLTNPHTAAAWLAGDLIQAGVESRA